MISATGPVPGLDGIESQTVPAFEIIVVSRSEDAATTVQAVPALHRVRSVIVSRPGVVFAMAAGAATASGDVIAFCDDDAIPRPDWIQRIGAAFADSDVGAFGGRDVLGPPHPEYAATPTAGVLSTWGRLTGDHHRVVGAPRDVDVLKAVNMAFRRSALRFPRDLRGRGAQVHFEVPMCLAVRRDGWAVRLDPGLLVDHLPQMRFDSDRRDRPTLRAVSDSSFNYTYGLLSIRPELRWRRLVFGVLVGDSGSPGFARAGVALMRRDSETLRRLLPSLHGQVAAFIRMARGQSLALAEPGRLISG
jgi:glycosyltransferase involved in cell wall biosynthesis